MENGKQQKSKVTWKIFFIILTMLILFYSLIFYYGNEEKLSANTMTDLYAMNNATVKETNLFQTNDYTVVSKIKRNKLIFTQGFFMDTPETFIESGGLYKQSSLQRYKINEPDKPLYSTPVQNNLFAEGCALFRDKIYQLTWREGVV
jgi:glutamine cyclotransferase